MKQSALNSLRSIQRPVAFMLACIPAGSLAVTYILIRWTSAMADRGAMGDPNVTEILTGFSNLFREYAAPVLVLTVVLSVVNFLAALAARSRPAQAS